MARVSFVCLAFVFAQCTTVQAEPIFGDVLYPGTSGSGGLENFQLSGGGHRLGSMVYYSPFDVEGSVGGSGLLEGGALGGSAGGGALGGGGGSLGGGALGGGGGSLGGGTLPPAPDGGSTGDPGPIPNPAPGALLLGVLGLGCVDMAGRRLSRRDRAAD